MKWLKWMVLGVVGAFAIAPAFAEEPTLASVVGDASTALQGNVLVVAGGLIAVVALVASVSYAIHWVFRVARG